MAGTTFLMVDLSERMVIGDVVGCCLVELSDEVVVGLYLRF